MREYYFPLGLTLLFAGLLTWIIIESCIEYKKSTETNQKTYMSGPIPKEIGPPQESIDRALLVEKMVVFEEKDLYFYYMMNKPMSQCISADDLRYGLKYTDAFLQASKLHPFSNYQKFLKSKGWNEQ